MADRVGEAFLNALIQKLVDAVTSQDLLKSALEENELKEWKSMSEAIRAVLHDAEEKQITDKPVKIWLNDLRDFLYDLDDILSDIATEDSTSRNITTQPRSSIFNSLLHFFRNFFASGSDSKIREMTGRLQAIFDRKKLLNLQERLLGQKRKRAAEVQSTTSLVVESRVYGREADKAAIVEWLLQDGTAVGELSVKAIVGMAGIGKTTLAQLAFNDDQVSAHFDFAVWVCVSGYLDIFPITKTILQSVDLNSRDVNDLNNLQVKLKKKLTGKKFLLVLDNVWDKNSRSWDTLCLPMRVGASGSKIIVTTRNEGVAAVSQTCPARRLRQLSEDDCMAIFTLQALGRTNFEAHPELEVVGKKIVRKCGGLPLAATVLGGMLRNQTSQDEWDYILRSKIWDLPEDQNDILPALWLSYLQLPSHLKPCFAYCSIFPKDYEFDKDELVLLWIAEDFVQSNQGNVLKEGSKYFDDLLSRSFFQHAWRS